MDQGTVAMKPMAPASMDAELAAFLQESILPLAGRTVPPHLCNANDPGFE